MGDFQMPGLEAAGKLAATPGHQDDASEQRLRDFQSAVASLIGPFAEMARLLSPVDPRGTVIERGNKVLEVRHFHNLRNLFETLTKAEAAHGKDRSKDRTF